MSVLLVIPARYASARYPGKALVELTGATGEKKTLIQRSWEAAQAVSGIDRVVVATDDGRIRDAAEGFAAFFDNTSRALRDELRRYGVRTLQVATEQDMNELLFTRLPKEGVFR